MSSSYPVGFEPSTWEMNDIFVNQLKKSVSKWKKLGFGWKYGVEIEFIPKTVKGFDDYIHEMNKIGDDILFFNPSLGPSIDLRKSLSSEVSDLRHFIDSCVLHISSHSDCDSFFCEFGTKKEEVLTKIEQIYESTKSDDDDVSQQARLDCFLMFLTVMPYDLGGLRGKVKASFGNYRRGRGWWDSSGVAEFRTFVHDDYSTFIDDYHFIIRRVFDVAYDFGIVPCFNTSGTQLNFSLWNIDTGENVMAYASDDSLNIAKKCLAGIHFCMSEHAYVLNDDNVTDSNFSVNFSTGHARSNTIRQKRECWELRRSAKCSFLHLSKDLSFLISSSLHGFVEIDDFDDFCKINKIEIKIVKHMKISLKNVYSGLCLQNVLSHSSLAEDGSLDVPVDAIKRDMDHLLFEVVGNKQGSFQSVPKGKRKKYDLSNPAVWKNLFSLVKLNEDLSFDVSALPEDIRESFSEVKVDGFFTTLESPCLKPIFGVKRLNRVLDENKRVSKQFLSRSSMLKLNVIYKKKVSDHISRTCVSFAQNTSLLMKDMANQENWTKKEYDYNISHNIYHRMGLPFVFEEVYFAIHSPDLSEEEKEHARNRKRSEFLSMDHSEKTFFPVFKSSLTDEINRQRSFDPPNNYVISGLYDTLTAIETKSVFDFSLTLESTIVDAVLVAFRELRDQNRLHVAKRNASLVFHELYMGFQLLLSDDRYSDADVVAMVESSKLEWDRLINDMEDNRKRKKLKNLSRSINVVKNLKSKVFSEFDDMISCHLGVI